jgi:hypothetical protein
MEVEKDLEWIHGRSFHPQIIEEIINHSMQKDFE